jgi:pantetheine-phosphate adenylyltransferase
VATVLCAGSFDPPTNGHVDILERAARRFERVVAAVVKNPAKHPLFDAEQRVRLLADALSHLDNVDVAAFDGLLVEFARRRGVTVVLKGVRSVSDFGYELQMAHMNGALAPEIDTVFMAARPAWSFVSSSLVKEVAALGGAVDALVPPGVARALEERLGQA